jgi:hypothetical protein
MPGRYSDELKRMTRAKSERLDAGGPSAQEPGQPDRARWRYGPLLVVAVVAALTGVGWLLLQQMTADAKLQDCVMSGRKNCVPPVMSAGR